MNCECLFYFGNIFLLMTYHCGSKLQVSVLTESLKRQNNFVVVTKLRKLDSCDKAVKISGGVKGAEQTYKTLAQKLFKAHQKIFFIRFLCLIPGIWYVSTLLNRQLRKSQREQFFHQKIIFCQISNVCRDIFISVKVWEVRQGFKFLTSLYSTCLMESK